MIFFLLFVAIPICLIFLLPNAKWSGKNKVPPGPIGLPFIGNLHQFDTLAPHIYFWKLSKKYGKIFSFKLTSNVPIVVVSSAKLAKEVLKTQDLVFCSRPYLVGQQKLSYNGHDIAFAPYNDYWREMRKICVLHLFSLKKVQLFSPIREDEVSRMIKKIYQQAINSQVTNLSNLMISLNSTIICRVAFGVRFDEEAHERKRFNCILAEAQAMLASFFVSDFFPSLSWIDKLTGMTDRLEKNFKDLDEFYEELIEQHYNPNRPKSMEGDFIDLLLQLKKDQLTPIDLSLDDIKGILMNVLLAGSDTSSSVIIWAMTILIKNPKAMKKVQEEIRNLIGNKGIVNEDDIQNMHYLKAVIKETLRLFPPAPLLIPRESMKISTLEGYEFQPRTIVYVNAWAITRDPEIWENPEEFMPERFLNSDIDFKGQGYELIPFGAGRRGCPGLALGVASVELALSNLLYAFDWELPYGLKIEDIDINVEQVFKRKGAKKKMGILPRNRGGEGGMVVVDMLSERATMMRESVQKSQSITDNMVSILGSFDHRLSALETAMRPTQIRTHAIRKAHENIDRTLKAADVILSQFDLSRQAEAKILKGPHEDLESYLEAIEQLRNNIRFFDNNKSFKSSDGVLNNANSLLAKAISKLEDEFKQLLSSYSKPVEPERLFECLPTSMRPSTGSPGDQDSSSKNHLPSSHGEHNHGTDDTVYTPPALIPPRILPLLHDLSQQMVQAGHQQQLVKIYREVRFPVLEESLRKLGVEKLSKDDVQKMQWEVLEFKIGNWIHYMRIAVKLLFAAERKVCDQMFEGFEQIKDQCFADVTTGSVAMLLSFGDAIAKSKRSPEKLFVLLDMYEIMRELHTEIELLFRGKSCNEIRESAFGLSKRLAQTAQETFRDFEEAVEKDATKTAVSDGTVHPLTSYVINYVKFLFDYQSTLKQLFQEFENGDSNSQLAAVTMRIMQALQTNLDGKSKQYKDPSLTNLFLMNNIHYMVRSVRRSEAKDLLGDDWVQRHRRVVQQHANQYKRIAWAKILQCLSIQGLTSSGGSNSMGVDGQNSSGVSRALVKERLKTFNIQFEDLHQRQSQWTVPDTELRESLRLAVAEVLLPAYRSFIKRFGLMVESGKNPQKYIRYSAEDLERMLGEFFEGKTLNEPKR